MFTYFYIWCIALDICLDCSCCNFNLFRQFYLKLSLAQDNEDNNTTTELFKRISLTLIGTTNYFSLKIVYFFGIPK